MFNYIAQNPPPPPKKKKKKKKKKITYWNFSDNGVVINSATKPLT